MSAEVGGAAPADLDDLLAARILDVEGQPLTGRDLVAAGVVSGRWLALERELVEGLGLVATQAPPETEVAAAVREFRLARKLFSAEDVRAWMRPRRLTMAQLQAAAARAVARRAGGEQQPADASQVAATLPAEAIYTGAMQEIGWWLADRMLSAKASGAKVEPSAVDAERVRRLVAEESETVAARGYPEPAAERARRLARIAVLDDQQRSWEKRVVEPRAVARLLRERSHAWCRYELDELRLPSAAAAAEVAIQLSEGRAPERVAAAAGVTVSSVGVVLEDADPRLARTLTGAIAGSVAGPWAHEDEHIVSYVRERRLPDIDDEGTVSRARAELLAETSERLRAGKVRWHERI